MKKGKSDKGAVKYRKITIEVREDVAERLDNSARSYARYETAADVAAECVHLYFELLESVDEDAEKIKRALIRERISVSVGAVSRKSAHKRQVTCGE